MKSAETSQRLDPGDAALLTTIDAERRCCRFLRFEIAVEAPDGGPIWLSLGGPPGTREFLGALFQP